VDKLVEDYIMANETPRDLVSKLLKRREELRLESEALDNLIRTYQQLMMLEKVEDPEQLKLWRGERPRHAKSAYVAEVMSEVRRITIGEARPMTRSELVRRLELEGYVLDGRDKSKVLGTNIWRSEQFNHIEGQGYWPKDVPLPRKV
jgi:reverse gyrase